MVHMNPCRGICEKDASTGWCIGCGRSDAEIVGWQSYDDATKLGLIRKDLKERLRKMGRWPLFKRQG